ncbi:MAG: hypothetical protein AAF195_00050 [Pseudomonadota bacterium]
MYRSLTNIPYSNLSNANKNEILTYLGSIFRQLFPYFAKENSDIKLDPSLPITLEPTITSTENGQFNLQIHPLQPNNAGTIDALCIYLQDKLIGNNIFTNINPNPDPNSVNSITVTVNPEKTTMNRVTALGRRLGLQSESAVAR